MIGQSKLSKAERLDLFSRGYRVAIVREQPDGTWKVSAVTDRPATGGEVRAFANGARHKIRGGRIVVDAALTVA